MSRKILMLVDDFAEDYEAMVPFQALQMVGRHFMTSGKPVASICHGAQILAAAWPAHPVWLSQFTKLLESRVPVHS